MGGSAAEIPTPSKAQPAVGSGLRASDAEREQVAARLRDEFVAGRLSHETFVLRMHAVLEARNLSDLPPLLADLPARQPPVGQPPAGQPLAPAPTPAPAQAPRSLVGRLRGAWSRMRGPADPGQPTGQHGAPSYGTPQHGAPQPDKGWPDRLAETARPDVARPRAALQPGRAVTVGMQVAAAENRPMSLRFPRGGDGEFSIGRDASCDLAIADMTVSRRHATLQRTDEGWILTDLASTNGTRVNGWRVRGRVEVKAGDLVTFGNAETVLIPEEELPRGGGTRDVAEVTASWARSISLMS
jgi:FHA domain/Domain of unknown function (DUF1707)